MKTEPSELTPEPAFDEAILRAAERVALGDAADELHRVIDALTWKSSMT